MLLEVMFKMSEEVTEYNSTSCLFVFSIWGLCFDIVPSFPLLAVCSFPQSPFRI